VAVPAATRAWVLELFEELGGVTARPMMGGLFLHRDGQPFALVTGEERIYLKAAGDLAEALAAEGSVQFTYRRAGKPARLGYWSLPDPAIDDPEAACDWARRALVAAGS
jgi:DNA transformation protein and related proteins